MVLQNRLPFTLSKMCGFACIIMKSINRLLIRERNEDQHAPQLQVQLGIRIAIGSVLGEGCLEKKYTWLISNGKYCILTGEQSGWQHCQGLATYGSRTICYGENSFRLDIKVWVGNRKVSFNVPMRDNDIITAPSKARTAN